MRHRPTHGVLFQQRVGQAGRPAADGGCNPGGSSADDYDIDAFAWSIPIDRLLEPGRDLQPLN